MRRVLHAIFFILATCGLGGCKYGVIEMPWNDPLRIELTCYVPVVNLGDITTELARSGAQSRSLPEGATIYYIIEISGADGTTQRHIFPMDDQPDGGLYMTTKVAPIVYNVRGYLAYYYKQKTVTSIFDTDDLSSVRIVGEYPLSLAVKDLFVHDADVDLTQYKDKRDVKVTHTIALERPYAKVRVISSDYDKYLEEYNKGNLITGLPTYCRVTYTTNIPLGYNIVGDRPTAIASGVSFIDRCAVISGTDIEIMRDYLLINHGSSAVAIHVSIYDDKMKLIASAYVNNDNIIPLKRGFQTTVRANMLFSTAAGPDISIDPDFDGEIDWVVPD